MRNLNKNLIKNYNKELIKQFQIFKKNFYSYKANVLTENIRLFYNLNFK